MTAAELHKALHQMLAHKLADHAPIASLVEDIARDAVQIMAPTLEAYVEACALLAQTLALVNPKEFRTPVEQDRLRQVREFLARTR